MDEIELIRMSKLSEMNRKLNKALNKENRCGNLEKSSSKYQMTT